MALSVTESSAVTGVFSPSMQSYVDPIETTAMGESTNFNISQTATLTNYLTAKATEVSAFSTYQADIATAAADKALYFSALSVYQLDPSLTNRTAVDSAFSTWQSDLLDAQSDRLAWVLASENTFMALEAMKAGE